MTEPLLCRVLADRYEWLENGSPRQGAIEEVGRAAAGGAVVLILPAASALVTVVDVAGVGRRQLAKALPFALEEYLAEEPEAYHFAGHLLSGGKAAAAAVSHQKMRAFVQPFAQAGIRLAGVYPETLFLPAGEDRDAVLIDREHAVVRYGNYQGGGIEPENLPIVLAKILKSPSAAISVYAAGADVTWPGREAAVTTPVASPLDLFRQHSPPKPLNLAVGDYRPAPLKSGRGRRLLPALALTALAALVQLLAAFHGCELGKDRLAALRAENEQAFRRLFPEVKRIVNLKVQTAQQLQALTRPRRRFLPMLYAAGDLLRRQPELRLTEAAFDDAVLRVVIEADSREALEQFGRQLAPANGTAAAAVEDKAGRFSARFEFR